MLKDDGETLHHKLSVWVERLGERTAKDAAAAQELVKGDESALRSMRAAEVGGFRSKAGAAMKELESLSIRLLTPNSDGATVAREMHNQATKRDEFLAKAEALERMTVDEYRVYTHDTFNVDLELMDKQPAASFSSPTSSEEKKMTTDEIKAEVTRARSQVENNDAMQQMLAPHVKFWKQIIEEEYIFSKSASVLAVKLSHNLDAIKGDLRESGMGISTAASNCTELSKMLIHAATYTHLVNDAKKSSPLSGSAAAADSSGADESKTKEPPFGRSDSWRKPKDKTDMQLLEQARNGNLKISAKIGTLALEAISPRIFKLFGKVIELNAKHVELVKAVYGDPVVSAITIKSPVSSPNTATITADATAAQDSAEIRSTQARLSFGGSGAKTGGAGEGAGVQKKPSKSKSSKKKNKKNGGRK